MSKKWVSGEFNTPRDLIEALVGEEPVFNYYDGRPVVLSDNGMIVYGGNCNNPNDINPGQYGYIKEIPWYECIPESGRLCWVDSGEGKDLVRLMIHKGGVFTDGFYNDYKPKHYKITPLTNEEIKQFIIEE